MPRAITIAAAQMGPIARSETRAAVVRRLIALMREAAAMGAQVVAYPEAALTAFFPHWWIEDEDQIDAWFEREMPGPDTMALFDEARRLGVGFHLGYCELDLSTGRKRRFNSAILVDHHGDIIGKYRKIHLPGHADHRPDTPFQNLEKRCFEVGDLGFGAWNAWGGVAGMLICNDRRWPEAFRALTLQGAELITLGFNTPTENLHYPEPPALRVHHHLIMAQAMAFMNATWLVETAKCGFEDGFRMFGHSLIVAPSGEIVAKTVSEDDELISFDADLDLAQDLKRTMFNYAAHRRPEHYRILIDRVGAQVTPHNA